MSGAPLIVGIGGTTRPGSTTESAVARALQVAREGGADTRIFGGCALAAMSVFAPERPVTDPAVRELLEAVRRADGLVIGSPGYHGGISGLVKNALDHLEGLRADERPYFDGRAVGCIVTASGWQACGSTLASLRAVIHALRGWPTPFGAVVNTAETRFSPAGECLSLSVDGDLRLVGQQVVSFARAAQAFSQTAGLGEAVEYAH